VDCNELLEQLGDYLDENLRKELCQAIEEHMTRCPDCRVQVDTIKKTIVLYQAGEDREIEVPPSVSSRLQTALSQEYTRAAGTTHD
jgi:predicted anti-sigma-YlaC factor YlaD